MESYDPQLDRIIELKRELNRLFLEHYFEREVFRLTWWIAAALLVVPLVVWWKKVDKSRLTEIMVYGFACNMIAGFLDVFLSDFGMWEYPTRIFPQISLFIPVDYVIVPVIGMYLYQKFPRWSQFLLACTVASAVMTFVGEPLAVAINMYHLITWRYVYSFPIYIAIYAAVKWFTHMVVKHRNR